MRDRKWMIRLGDASSHFGNSRICSRPSKGHGTGATLVTCRSVIATWYLGSGRLADAIRDRLVHNTYRVELASKESIRKERAALNEGGQFDK
jgi:hypothetical protein